MNTGASPDPNLTGSNGQIQHIHLQCSHELHHCIHCDVVYCSKCIKEWKQQVWSGARMTNVPYYAPNLPITLYANISAPGIVSTLATSHNHDHANLGSLRSSKES